MVDFQPGRCSCGGVYETRLVEIRQGATVLTGARQGVCPLCNSEVYGSTVLERIENIMHGVADDSGARRAAG